MNSTQSNLSAKNICLWIACGIGGGVFLDQMILGHLSTPHRQIALAIAALFFLLFWLIPSDIRKTLKSWPA